MNPALKPPFIVGMIIPTGVGASIGGFGGDAMTHMNLLASVSDVLITHPNVANAAAFQRFPENALYVEGYALDRFLQGDWALRPARSQKVGVILDVGITEDMRILHLNTINAVKTVYGVDLAGYVVTEAPIDCRLTQTESGCSTGSLRNPEAILRAAEQLIRQGATAIALCTLLEGCASEAEASYRAGEGVDPIGGIEAILSHLVVSTFGVPCANAPVFHWETARPVTDVVLDPRTASEFITPTFLPCVLLGLSRSPDIAPASQSGRYGLTVDQLSALVLPADALGGIPALTALERNIPIIGVEENRTVLSVRVDAYGDQLNYRAARSYEEAAGMLQAMKLGLHLPRVGVTRQTGDPAAPELQCHPVPDSPHSTPRYPNTCVPHP